MKRVSDLPPELTTRAFVWREEAAWPRDQAQDVVHYLADKGVVVLGGEVWLRGPGAPRIPFLYTWAVTKRRQEESHGDYVERACREALAYIRKFAWALGPSQCFDEEEALFNLTF